MHYVNDVVAANSVSVCVFILSAVFHGFGGRMAVSDTGMTPLNKIIDRCFKEIGLKQRDYNGRTHFGSSAYTLRLTYTSV